MIKFSKFILDRMSINEYLFMKELRKLIIRAKEDGLDELRDFRDFCIRTYGNKYKNQIIQTFNTSLKNS